MASELGEEELVYLDPGDCDSAELSATQLRSLTAEVRRHRAARLTDEEVEALGWVVTLLDGAIQKMPGYERVVALAAIERLLAHSRDGAGE